MVRNFVVAVDKCAASTAAVEFVLRNLAQAEGDVVHLVHCYKRLQTLAGQHFAYVPSDVEQESMRKEEYVVLQQAADTIKQARPNQEVHTYLVAGDPRDEIVELAEKLDAECVVLGSRGLGAVKRAILGSVSSAISHSCSRPVIIVHGK
eukprot:m.235869 g.235869  ORF g.235869 m.235869 type:complete len:149 (-) comp20313_c0_seq1:39-485(-)